MLPRHFASFFTLLLGGSVALIACGDDATPADDGAGGDTGTTTTSGMPSTASSTSTSTTTSGSGGGQNISCTPGENTNIPEGECSLLNQNCPAGTGCEPVNGATTTGCVQGGLKEAGMACTNTNECAGGTACVFDKCAPFCCPENHQPCGGGFCNVNINYGDGAFAYVCSFPAVCELFEDDQCGANEDCHPMWDQGIATCTQPSGNPAAEGEDCSFINDCGDMQSCTGGKCRYACDLVNYETLDAGKGGCADATQSCVQVSNNQIPGVGVCQPM